MSDPEQTPIIERIRHRAYELWEEDGRPHGKSDDYWQMAREQIEAEALAEQNDVLNKARDE